LQFPSEREVNEYYLQTASASEMPWKRHICATPCRLHFHVFYHQHNKNFIMQPRGAGIVFAFFHISDSAVAAA
jgi:hypothetical protein